MTSARCAICNEQILDRADGYKSTDGELICENCYNNSTENIDLEEE